MTIAPRFAGFWRHLAALALLLAAAHAGAATSAPQRIQLAGSPEPTQVAHWWPAAGPGTHPAVIGLHGCGGLYNRKGALSARFREYAERWHAAGYSVLLPDSWTTHGHRRVCQTPYDQRHHYSAQRQADVRAAVAWLHAQPDVDASRVALVGWSNGASTALRAIDPARGPVPELAGVAVFYPGCAPLMRRSAVLAPVPLLMQLGADDNWTPAAPCAALAVRLQQAGHDVTLRVYEGSVHGFDGTEPLRIRADVPNGADPHHIRQGGNPQARAAAIDELQAFLQRVLAPKGRS
ncbi:MAG: dienelactone hydrolase family protein [Burkholderiaceae bacterium]